MRNIFIDWKDIRNNNVIKLPPVRHAERTRTGLFILESKGIYRPETL